MACVTYSLKLTSSFPREFPQAFKGHKIVNERRCRHFLVLADVVPSCFFSGGGITAYAVTTALLDRGHRVSVVVLRHSEFGEKPESEHVSHLKERGASVEFLPSCGEYPRRKRVFPRWFDLFPGIERRGAFAKAIQRIQPDAMLFYHWEAAAASFQATSVPKCGLVGDPVHLPMILRRQFRKRMREDRGILNVLRETRAQFLTRSMLKGMRLLLNDCNVSGAFAAHHANLFTWNGVRNCRYFRTPIPDPLPPQRVVSKPERLRILHIGHLEGIATLSGIELLAKDVIPSLTERMGVQGFEVHIVGGEYEAVPNELKGMLEHPAVRIRGHISPPDGEFLSSHIVLVPTPIELGIRVRILTAFSYGACVVAHSANKAGIPELEHTKNCLLADTGEMLANHCVEVFKNADIRNRLEAEGRRTFDNHFAVHVAGARIAETVEQIANSVCLASAEFPRSGGIPRFNER